MIIMINCSGSGRVHPPELLELGHTQSSLRGPLSNSRALRRLLLLVAITVADIVISARSILNPVIMIVFSRDDVIRRRQCG
mgnify:CR=1 FL=1